MKSQEPFWDYATRLVREFNEAFDTSKDPELWYTLISEESAELIEADGPVEELKEACDVVYVTAGYKLVAPEGFHPKERSLWANCEIHIAAQTVNTILKSMTEPAFREAFTRVHHSNMSKLGDDGKPVRREDGKIMKGPNYQPPYLDDLINNKE